MLNISLDIKTINKIFSFIPELSIEYQKSGFVRIYKKLKFGMGQLICIPDQHKNNLVLAVPIKTIRWSLSSGLAQKVTLTLWSKIKASLLEQIVVILKKFDLPEDTVEIGEFMDNFNEPVGVIVVDLLNVNNWVNKYSIIKFNMSEITFKELSIDIKGVMDFEEG